jgi:hypothetical protein
MLRKGLAGGVASGESSFDQAVKSTLEPAVKRFEHYELKPARRQASVIRMLHRFST